MNMKILLRQLIIRGGTLLIFNDLPLSGNFKVSMRIFYGLLYFKVHSSGLECSFFRSFEV